MIFLDGDRDIEELVSKPKGMKRLLQERGLWNANLKKQCGRQKKDKSKFDEMIEVFGDRVATGRSAITLDPAEE